MHNLIGESSRYSQVRGRPCSAFFAAWMASLVFALGCFAPGNCAGGEGAVRKEYQLKAAFIYNFTKFIEWPAECFPDANAPIVIAVADQSPCTAELGAVVKGRKVNERDLAIKTVTTLETAKGFHILFIPATEDERLEKWMEAVRGKGVLVVGESEAFLKRGGMINFLLEEEKIRFEINMDQTEAARLKISAQLQKLAKSIRRKSQP